MGKDLKGKELGVEWYLQRKDGLYTAINASGDVAVTAWLISGHANAGNTMTLYVDVTEEKFKEVVKI